MRCQTSIKMPPSWMKKQRSLTVIPKMTGAKLELDSRPPGCELFVLATTPQLNQRQILFMIISVKLEKDLSL